MTLRILCRRQLCALLLAAVCTLAAQGQDASKPIDPAKQAAIDEFFRLAKPQVTINQALQQYKTMMAQQLDQAAAQQIAARGGDPSKYTGAVQNFESQLFALLAAQLDWQKLRPQMVALYDDTFTLDELKAINAFYATPAGQALIEKTPALMSKSAGIGQAAMTGALPQIQKMTADFMQSLSNPPKDNH